MVDKSSGQSICPKLGEKAIALNFSDMHPALSTSEALIESDRCYFCYDAPCVTACPTGIDIPMFIQQIRSGNNEGSARTILQENIMGGMCARVCPTEILCEQACVRNTHEEKPVEIGLLQRHATDPIIDAGRQLFNRAPRTGKNVAVVGAGPAGMSCAHRLAMLGHDVVVLDAAQKPGGLNEYGLAAYKTVDNFAQKEIDYILAIGGIEIRNGVSVGPDLPLARLQEDYDAVFVGAGLAQVNALGLEHSDAEGMMDAVDYIAEIRQTEKLSTLPVGNNIVVIGGGMTAIDIAVQSKLLGSENVTIAYRRGPEQMAASPFEQDYARKKGVVIKHWLAPNAIHVENGRVVGIDFLKSSAIELSEQEGDGALEVIPADVVFKAIGQRIDDENLGDLAMLIPGGESRIAVDEYQRTNIEGVWAGGDCVRGGEDLTVSAVQDGKIAAIDMHAYLQNKKNVRKEQQDG